MPSVRGAQSFASIAPANMRLTDRRHIAPRNLNHERDIRYVTRLIGGVLSSIGISPVMHNNAGRYLSNIAYATGNLLLCFAIVPCGLHIVYEEKDTMIRLKLLGLLSFCVTSIIKYGALAARRSGIRNCMEFVKTDWKLVQLQGDREIMLKYGKVGRNLTIICATFMYSGGMIYHTILQWAVGNTIDEYNNTIKPLAYPTYSAWYDPQRTPVYEIVFVLHCMCGYVIYSVTTGACGLAALFATHACGQIEIVTSRLEDLVDGKLANDHSTPDQRLTDAVKHHLRVLRFSAMIEQILQEVCFVEFAGSTFMICLLEYYCITDWEQNNMLGVTTYSLLLMSLSFNIFVLCYIGELLMEKTGDVGMLCYMIEWYRLPTKTMRGLVLIIAMSNSPVKISAGRMAELSLSTFGNILKTSLAYLSFLRTAVM